MTEPDDGARSHRPPPVSAAGQRENDFSLSAELRKLRQLRDEGVLSTEEYDEVKAALMAAWQ